MRVLVVEDEAKMAGLLLRALDELEAVSDHVGDGTEALVRAATTPYDLILLDWMLPGADGIEVCRRLRAEGNWTPVLMLTARDAIADRVRGLDVGADDYLVKPFAVDELLARVRALVRRGAAPRPITLTVGDLELDPAAVIARRGGTELELSSKEFQMLEAFMRRPGTTLSRDDLLGLVWDHAYEHRSNVIDVYIRYLREKIDRPFGRASLETVRGHGYRLVDDRAGDA
ncbi:MAG: response regulator transcription factor [Solirubrobacteraceae bacterium]|nr:response regulator transcription factor [Solirubrobacteraceae bacterium]